MHAIRKLLFFARGLGLVIMVLAAAPAGAVPEGARVTLAFDKDTYFLGENVLGHFCVENAGDKPFLISMGGDYRGAVRATRFKVTAVDTQGQAVVDPYPGDNNFGGLMSEPTLKPGERFYDSLPLMHYLRFDAPGEYTVRVQHDLGWKVTKEQPLPVAEAKITFVMPTPEQAKQVFEDIARLPTDDGVLVGQKRKPLRDFCSLRYPVYLPILQERAPQGSTGLIEAIGNIATPEATQALIDLLPNANGKVSLAAAGELLGRLPLPPDSTRLPSFWNESNSQRKWLIEQSWRSEFASPIRANARKALQSTEREALHITASTLQRIGEKDDLPDVLAALERRIALTVLRPRWQSLDDDTNDGWQLQDDCLMLISAAHALLKRGAALPSPPRTAAEAAVLLRAAGVDESLRPPNWEAQRLKMLRHAVPFIRQLALESLSANVPMPKPDSAPQPLPSPLLALMPTLLNDPDTSVREAACALVWRTKEARLKAPLLQVLRTGKSKWLLDMASEAAISSGAQYDMWLIWADRLDESGLLWTAVNQLAHVIKGVGGGGWNTNVDRDAGRRLKPLWQALLKQNRSRLQSGKLFEISEAALSPALFPKEFHVSVDGKEWPPNR